MGKESRQKKQRKCVECDRIFEGLTAPQIEMHAVVCGFERRTGIEVISMNQPIEAPSNESLIIMP